MGLVRVTTQLATTIIRQIGDNGGVIRRDVESELDSLIAWAKLSPRRIHIDTSTVGNVGTGLDPLHSYSLAANTLATNDDELDIIYSGGFINNADTKRIQITADGQVVFNSGLRDFNTGLSLAWWVDLTYVRVSATSLRFSGGAFMGNLLSLGGGSLGATDTGNSRYYITALNGSVTVANLNSNAITLLVQGESSTATNDNVTQNLSRIYLVQQ